MRWFTLICLLLSLTFIAIGCQTPEQHAAAMAEARRLRGGTAYDSFPAFGEPYGEWGREKLSTRWEN
jgi:hypothetical protein